MTINSDAVMRHSSILDAPDEVVLCWAWGHRWEPGPLVERRDYGTTVWHVRAECPCTRIRTETIHPASGELLNREYGGGHGLNARVPVERHDARLEWGRRTRSRAKAANTAASGGGTVRQLRKRRGA